MFTFVRYKYHHHVPTMIYMIARRLVATTVFMRSNELNRDHAAACQLIYSTIIQLAMSGVKWRAPKSSQRSTHGSSLRRLDCWLMGLPSPPSNRVIVGNMNKYRSAVTIFRFLWMCDRPANEFRMGNILLSSVTLLLFCCVLSRISLWASEGDEIKRVWEGVRWGSAAQGERRDKMASRCFYGRNSSIIKLMPFFRCFVV